MTIVHSAPERWVVFKVAAYPFLGRRVLVPRFDGPAVALGVISHLLVSVTWGVLFALLVHGLSRRATVWLGALWGLVVWLGMFFVVLPVLAPALSAGGYSPGVILSEVAFGLAIGIAFAPYQRENAPRRWWRTRLAPLGGKHPAAHAL
jgi:hypothetical protein